MLYSGTINNIDSNYQSELLGAIFYAYEVHESCLDNFVISNWQTFVISTDDLARPSKSRRSYRVIESCDERASSRWLIEPLDEG